MPFFTFSVLSLSLFLLLSSSSDDNDDKEDEHRTVLWEDNLNHGGRDGKYYLLNDLLVECCWSVARLVGNNYACKFSLNHLNLDKINL